MEQPVRLDDGRTLEHAKVFYIQTYRGLRTLWYSGGSGGYRAYLLRFPEQHFSVACLCNLASVNRAKRAHAVADLYLGSVMNPKDGVSATTLTAGQLQRLTGTYREPRTKALWRVSVEAGKLWIDSMGHPAELRGLTATEFEIADDPRETRLIFEPSQRDRARKLIIKTQFALPATAEAIVESQPAAEELAAYAGDYWSEELRATYRLGIEAGKLRMMDLIGADGIVHRGNIPSSELRPVLRDEFDLKGMPLIFSFTRDEKGNVTGFTLNGLLQRGIVFAHLNPSR
jgi:hypothetical protein